MSRVQGLAYWLTLEKKEEGSTSAVRDWFIGHVGHSDNASLNKF